MKHLFNEGLKGRIDRFVSIDGTGLGITHISVGSLRYRVTFKGPGGHSYGAFGMVNPIHALGRAMAAIGDFQVPHEPKTTFNVGRIGGGTSVNSIPFEAWMEVDMRSADAASLQSLDAKFHHGRRRRGRRRERAVGQPRAQRRQGARRQPPGGPRAGHLRRSCRRPSRSPGRSGFPVTLDEGSTDANYPQSLGIPAITIDGGGRGTRRARARRGVRHHRLVEGHAAGAAADDRAGPARVGDSPEVRDCPHRSAGLSP